MGTHVSGVSSEPQPRGESFLRLVDPATQEMATLPAPDFSNRCERAGAEVGFLARRLVSRSLRWFDGRQEQAAVNAPARSATLIPAVAAIAQTSEAPSSAIPAPSNGPVAFSRETVSPVRRPTSFAADAQRSSLPSDGQSSAKMQLMGRQPSLRFPSAEAGEAFPAAQRLHAADFGAPVLVSKNDLSIEKAYDLAAETIPPLLTFALRNLVRPSWAQLAEVGCTVAINASRIFHTSQPGKDQPRSDQPRSMLTVLASVTFAIASGVATISSSGLLSLAATSPWTLALLGGVLLLAIVWRAMASQGALGLLPSLASGSMAMG